MGIFGSDYWGAPQLLWLLALLPLVIGALAIDGQRRRRVLERIGDLTMVARMTASLSPGRRRWRAVLTMAALTLALVALAQPRVLGKTRIVDERGLDLVVALDLSKSMLASDVRPTRLARAKLELEDMVDHQLDADRLGLVVFAGEYIAYPMTTDYEAMKHIWRGLEPSDMPIGGTDLGLALRASAELLADARAGELARHPDGKHLPAQVILLITDGDDTGGQLEDATVEVAKAGVVVYAVGIGTKDAPYVQLYDDEGRPAGNLMDADGREVHARMDDGALRQVAAKTRGKYFFVDGKVTGFRAVVDALGELQRSVDSGRREREKEDVGKWPLAGAFVLLVGATLVRERRRPARASTPPAASKAMQLLLLLLALPSLVGFDFFRRRDPNLEEGNRLLEANKPDEALAAYDRAVSESPNEPIVHFDRGVALTRLGRSDEAQKEFLRSAESHDLALKADSYFNLGNALFQAHRLKEAVEAYRRTLGLRPDDRRAKWNLELALRHLAAKQKQPKSGDGKADPDDESAEKKQKGADDKQKNAEQKPGKQKTPEQKAGDEKPGEEKPGEEKAGEQKAAEQKAAEQKGDDKQADGEPAPDAKQPGAAADARDQRRQQVRAILRALDEVDPSLPKQLAAQRARGRPRDKRAEKDW